MKTPPFLLLATLLFWGWQSELLVAGAVMGLLLESARFIKARWDLSDTDFRRIMTFCTVLAFATAVYAFSTNEEGGSFAGLFSGPGAAHNATITGMRTATAFFRWLPITLFFFVAAQIFSTREQIPWAAISIAGRWYARRQKELGRPGKGGINVSYPYFFLCLFSSGIHPNLGGVSYYWGQCLLVAWALWPFRSPRFGLVLWIAALAAAVAVGFGSQTGISGFQHFLEGYNAQWIARFLRQRTDPMQSTTSIGQIGSLKLSGRIVIRLHTPTDEAPPTYLREATYRIYHSAKCTWYAGSLRNDFENLSPEHDQTTWVLLRKTNVASVNIACYLNSRNPQTGNPLGLLPLPSGVGQLDNLNAYTLQKNGEAAVLAEGPGLVIFDADYSPGATLDSPPDSSTNQLDLEVPTNEVAALKQIIAGLKISGATEQQKLSAVAGFFAGHFTYSIWQGKDKLATTNESSLSRFLLTSRSGHCEYFATATVLLLRELKIPARYAVGYAVHEPAGSGYVVRERDAHAWCLAWDAATKTWIDFDTTPASWVSQEEKRATFWQHFSDFRSWIAFEIAKLRWGQTNLRQYILIGLTPVLLLLLYQILFRRGQKRRATKESKAPIAPIHWPGLDSEFYLLEQKLARRGLPRQPGESLSLWLERVLQSPDLADLRAPARKLLRLHYRHRFDPRGLNEADREILRREVVARLREPDGDRS